MAKTITPYPYGFEATKNLWNKQSSSEHAVVRGLQKTAYKVAAVFVALFETFKNALKAVANGVINTANALRKKPVEVLTPALSDVSKKEEEEVVVVEETATVAAQTAEKDFSKLLDRLNSEPNQPTVKSPKNSRLTLRGTAVAATTTVAFTLGLYYLKPELFPSIQVPGFVKTNLTDALRFFTDKL